MPVIAEMALNAFGRNFLPRLDLIIDAERPAQGAHPSRLGDHLFNNFLICHAFFISARVSAIRPEQLS
jgi:hypothetical protein